MTVKPITPDQIPEQKKADLPSEVIQVWNSIIAKNYSNGYARIDQEVVIQSLCLEMNILRQEVFERKYLDIEEIYRDSGWYVNYDKPGFNESYGAFFEFKKKIGH